MSQQTPNVEKSIVQESKAKPVKTEKLKPVKIGDHVKFFDEQNREFNGIVESANRKNYNIRVSRLYGHSQVYLGVPQSTKKKIKPRFN